MTWLRDLDVPEIDFLRNQTTPFFHQILLWPVTLYASSLSSERARHIADPY